MFVDGWFKDMEVIIGLYENPARNVKCEPVQVSVEPIVWVKCNGLEGKYMMLRMIGALRSDETIQIKRLE